MTAFEIVSKRGENTWWVRIFLGRDAEGKQVFYSHTVHGTKKDAQAYLNRVLRDRDLGIWSEPSEESVSAYLRRWLDDAAKPRIATATAALYEDYLTRYLSPGLGHVRLGKLTPLDIQGLYTESRDRKEAVESGNHSPRAWDALALRVPPPDRRYLALGILRLMAEDASTS